MVYKSYVYNLHWDILVYQYLGWSRGVLWVQMIIKTKSFYMVLLGNAIQAPYISSNVDVEEIDMIAEINGA